MCFLYLSHVRILYVLKKSTHQESGVLCSLIGALCCICIIRLERSRVSPLSDVRQNLTKRSTLYFDDAMLRLITPSEHGIFLKHVVNFSGTMTQLLITRTVDIHLAHVSNESCCPQIHPELSASSPVYAKSNPEFQHLDDGLLFLHYHARRTPQGILMGELERYAQNLAQFGHNLTHPQLTVLPEGVGMTATLFVLSVLYAIMAVFYVVRMFHPLSVAKCCGFFSYKNELAHVLCALGMMVMVVPPLFPGVYYVAWVVFIVITASYGIFLVQPMEKPSRFWRMLHTLDGLGMSVMFLMMLGASPMLHAFTWFFVPFYLVSTAYFGYWTVMGTKDIPFAPLAFWSDVFHTVRAGTMVLMFLLPQVFMWGHQGHVAPEPTTNTPMGHHHHH
jgi:hypothetical protein